MVPPGKSWMQALRIFSTNRLRLLLYQRNWRKFWEGNDPYNQSDFFKSQILNLRFWRQPAINSNLALSHPQKVKVPDSKFQWIFLGISLTNWTILLQYFYSLMPWQHLMWKHPSDARSLPAGITASAVSQHNGPIVFSAMWSSFSPIKYPIFYHWLFKYDMPSIFRLFILFFVCQEQQD